MPPTPPCLCCLSCAPLQLQYPAVVLAFEKLLLTGCIPVGGAVITWGLASGVGMSNAPYFLAAILCGLYFLLARPLPSSFQSVKDTALGERRGRGEGGLLEASKGGGEGWEEEDGAAGQGGTGCCSTAQSVAPPGAGARAEEARPRQLAQPICAPRSLSAGTPPGLAGGASKGNQVQDRSDGALAFLLVALLPAAVYISTHLAVLFSWFHLWSLLLLGAGPLLFVACLPGGGGTARGGWPHLCRWTDLQQHPTNCGPYTQLVRWGCCSLCLAAAG